MDRIDARSRVRSHLQRKGGCELLLRHGQGVEDGDPPVPRRRWEARRGARGGSRRRPTDGRDAAREHRGGGGSSVFAVVGGGSDDAFSSGDGRASGVWRRGWAAEARHEVCVRGEGLVHRGFSVQLL